MLSTLPAYFPIRIEVREGRGRCVIAARDLPAGSVVLASHPAALLCTDGERCAYCFLKPSESLDPSTAALKLATCASCKTCYCSRECQRADWNAGHKSACKKLLVLQKQVPQNVYLSMLLLARLYAGKQLRSSDDSAAVSFGAYRATLEDFRALQSTSDADASDEGAAAIPHDAVLKLGRELDLLPASVTDAEVLADLARFELNNFSLTSLALLVPGIGVYPAAALLNHSCEPTCTLSYGFAVDYHTTAGGSRGDTAGVQVVRTLVPVTAGTELTHAYCDVSKPRSERQSVLKAQYGFTCNCAACVMEAGADDSSIKEIASAADDGARDRVLTRARTLVTNSELIATEAEDPLTVSMRAAVQAEDGVTLPEADWRNPWEVVSLQCAVLVHAISLLRRYYQPYHPEIIAILHTVHGLAVLVDDSVMIEASLRHMMSSMRRHPPFQLRPAHPMLALREYAAAQIYKNWAQKLLAEAEEAGGTAAAAPAAVSVRADALTRRGTLADTFGSTPDAVALPVDAATITAEQLQKHAKALFHGAAAALRVSFGDNALVQQAEKLATA